MSKTSTIGSAASSMKRKNSIWHALPYIAPHFIIFAVFGIIPIIFGIGLAFTRWNMVGSPQFAGLQNFAKIFDPSTYFYSIFWRDLWHTLIFVLISVPLTIIVPLLLAVALGKKGLKGAGLFQAIFYIPGLISIAAGALVWRMVFNSQFGLLNTTFHTDINVWGQPVMLTNGGPNYQTQVLLMDIRNLAFPAGPAAAGMASAMALLLGIILMAIAAIQLIFMNKED